MVLFFVVAVIAAILLALIPTLVAVDAKTWNAVRVLVIIGLILWAAFLFVPLIRGLV